MNKVLLIGCGHMGSALLNAWIKLKTYSFTVIDPLKYESLSKKYNKKKIKFISIIPNNDQMKEFDIIIFAVKPQVVKKVIKEYQNFVFKKNAVIGSIIAEKKISFYKKNIKNAHQIVRIMPNMPALINAGVSCFVPNKNFSKNNKKKIDQLFTKVGITIWLQNEKQIDKATAISGSGPGYVFTLIEAFEKASQKIGFSKKISREMVLSTILGSAKLMEKTNKDSNVLANSIAVKGGTTEAGIKVLKKNNPNQLIYKVFLAAYKKATKLGNKND